MRNVVAVIDLGTLKTKFEVRDYTRSGQGKILFKDKQLNVIGRDLDKTGNIITDKSLAITIKTLSEMKAKMQELQVRAYKAVTTEAIRRAKNSKAVLKHIECATGIRFETLSHEEEAKVLFSSIAKDFPDKIIAVADVGGGSVQLVIGRNDLIYEIHLFKTGTYYLQEEFSKTHHPTLKELDNCREYVRKELISLANSKFNPELLVYGTSNIIDFLKNMKVELHVDRSSSPHSHFTYLKNLYPVYKDIIGLSYEDRMPMYPKEPYYMWAADKALINVFQICEYLGIDKIYPTNNNISTSLLFILSAFNTNS